MILRNATDLDHEPAEGADALEAQRLLETCTSWPALRMPCPQ
ncbi:hypothetical protein [Dactylosporangium sp. NPDC051541]